MNGMAKILHKKKTQKTIVYVHLELSQFARFWAFPFGLLSYKSSEDGILFTQIVLSKSEKKIKKWVLKAQSALLQIRKVFPFCTGM